jgi:peptidoglycan hydrolase-like protein with peptidoglycan-binding domain
MVRSMGRLHYGRLGGYYRSRPWGRRWSRYGRRRTWLHRRPFGLPMPMPSPLVSWAQGCLAQVLGAPLPQDGLMGPDTQQAIQQFQAQQQLPPTGILDSNTVNMLQAACSAQQAPQDVPPPPPAQALPPPPPAQAAPPPDGARRHGARQQTGELDEGGFTLTEQEEPGSSGRWVRHRGKIILMGL